MKKYNYIGLWSLLLVALAVIVTISFMDRDITIGSYTVKKAPIKDALIASGCKDSIRNIMDSDGELSELSEPKVIDTDSVPQVIFIFGDSMTFNIALRFAQYAKQNNHQIYSVNWDSSNTKIWAESDTLAHFISKYRPTQIYVSLGSNELYFKNPESRRPYIEKIVQVMDTIPFVWIGPPNWKEDTGLNDMIASICGNGRFFRSAGMEFKRKSDHVHPTRESSADWVDSIARWTPKSRHPYLLEIPSDSIGKSNPNIIFLKAHHK